MTPEELYRLADWIRSKHPAPSPLQTPPEYTVSTAMHGLADGIIQLADDTVRRTDHVVTDRGFVQFEPVDSTYGGQIRVYESSAALGPHIWIDIKSPAKLQEVTGPPDGMTAGTAHLTLEGATKIRDQLTWIIENHYQVRER